MVVEVHLKLSANFLESIQMDPQFWKNASQFLEQNITLQCAKMGDNFQ